MLCVVHHLGTSSSLETSCQQPSSQHFGAPGGQAPGGLDFLFSSRWVRLETVKGARGSPEEKHSLQCGQVEASERNGFES